MKILRLLIYSVINFNEFVSLTVSFTVGTNNIRNDSENGRGHDKEIWYGVSIQWTSYHK